jgi:hypothetical protein
MRGDEGREDVRERRTEVRVRDQKSEDRSRSRMKNLEFRIENSWEEIGIGKRFERGIPLRPPF